MLQLERLTNYFSVGFENANSALFFGYIDSHADHVIPPKSEFSNCSKPHLLPFSLVGYAGADPYLLKRMLIIRGLADSFHGGCKIQRAARQANYSPYYKKSATVGVNYSLTITLSMVLNRAAPKDSP